MPIVDVSQWATGARDGRGRREKVWIFDPEGHEWLRKSPAHSRPFEPVIEWIAYQVAGSLNVRCAEAKLCFWEDHGIVRRGLISKNFVARNEVLHSGDIVLADDPHYSGHN